jgi:predicted RNase H-like HicB family nuclease
MVDELLKASAAARYLGVTRQRIYELAATGRLGQRIAGYWVFSPAELDQYREQRSYNLGGRPRHEQAQAEVQERVEQHDVAQGHGPVGTVERYVAAALSYATVQPLPSGGYIGASLDFPEINALATTRAECASLLQTQLEQLIQAKIRLGQALPVIDGLTPTATND